MTLKLISTPVPGYSGKVGAVQFVNGEAQVDDNAQEMAYFRSAGYGIADLEEAIEAVEESDPDRAEEIEELDPQGGTQGDGDPQVLAAVDGEHLVLPRKSASAEEWRKFALNHDKTLTEDDVAGMSRADLIDRFTDDDEEADQ